MVLASIIIARLAIDDNRIDKNNWLDTIKILRSTQYVYNTYR